MENKQDITFADQKIVPVQIEKNVQKSFIEYAMSVIVARALPDVRDGLKPVHRRILFAMYDDKLTYDRPFRKSATTVGNVLGRYHRQCRIRRDGATGAGFFHALSAD